ncbi:MAG TPA: cytidine deaminase [Candidatus Ozemobacteraceae bacterium]|nr:cytidine deaminase [Candidatus Ozemobacteraceae bacterium]
MKNQHDAALVEQAIEASKRAYAPYSKFHVGAALECADGEIILGCNVENASYGLTNCAERTALFSAIAQGKRDFKRLAIFVDTEDHTSPCGACRQVLAELAPNIEILLVNRHRIVKKCTVKELLPLAFGSEDLKHHAASL